MKKNITDNKKFWQAVKLFLSEKNKSREKITLIKENDEIISDDVEVANTLNKFFSKIVKNLKISERFVNNSLPHSLSSHPTLKAILKYKDHPSIPVIKRFSQRIKILFLKKLKK